MLEQPQRRDAEWMPYLLQAYKNLDQPNFDFVQSALDAKPYRGLVSALRDFIVVEVTFIDEADVCFSFLLKGRDKVWGLSLSMVGPFGCLSRLSNRLCPQDLLTSRTPGLHLSEGRVIGMLETRGIRLMTAPELSTPINLRSFHGHDGGGSGCLYHALFVDTPRLPWEN